MLKPGGRCFVWLGRFGRNTRLCIARVVGLFSEQRAAIIRAPGMSLRQSENITPANSFCAGLGLSVSCLTCMGGAILYPLLIFIGTSTWYWGAMILGTYSIALALPMAAIAVAVGNYTWQFASRPKLTRALQFGQLCLRYRHVKIRLTTPRNNDSGVPFPMTDHRWSDGCVSRA